MPTGSRKGKRGDRATFPYTQSQTDLDRFWDSAVPETHTTTRVSLRQARVNPSEIRIYPSNPDGTPFGYTSDKANSGFLRSEGSSPADQRRFQAAAFEEGFNENSMARPALRLSDADEEAGIDAHRHAFTRAWHRR
jgi:hypothetical protein